MSNVKEKLDQIRAIAGEISQEDPSAAVIVMVDTKNTQAGHVWGEAIHLATGLVFLMHQVEGFAAC